MIEKMYLGTYTRRTSQGIYTALLDTEEKKLLQATPVITEDNPTYLDKSLANVLYAVTKDGEKGGVSAYQENPDGSFTFLNKVLIEGAPPCYVAVDETRNLVFAANYHQGRVYVLKIQEDGSLVHTDTKSHDGSGPNPNQQGPHVHYTDLTPDDRLVVCDLGTDEVYTYDVSEEGLISEAARYKAAPGTGPRHLVFNPNGEVAYLFGELNSTVVVLAYDKNTGAFSTLQTISTLPEGFEGENGGAAIRITSDGEFVYASNRGHNSIVVYQTSHGGKQIDVIQHISTEGDHPRDFALDKTENFIVVANQNTDNLTLYTRNDNDGKLTMVQKDFSVPECVCVYFD